MIVSYKPLLFSVLVAAVWTHPIAGQTQLNSPYEPNDLRLAQSGESVLNPTPTNTADTTADFESRLKALRATTGRVSQQLQASPATPSTMAPSAPQPLPRAATPAAPLRPTGSSSANADLIRERIRLLRTLRSKSSPVPSPATPEPEKPALSPLPAMMETAKEPDPNIQAIEENLRATPASTPETTPPESIPENVEATEIVSGPVNSMALGQSLYRTGNYEAAMKAFDNVAIEPLDDADRAWLELMKAMCYRRMSRTADSEAILRTLANDKSSDYPVSAAKWWLKHSESVSDSRPFFDQTSQSVDTILERAKKHVQPTQ
ncbi:MAG: hypothetical protein AAFU85_21375 [Planctomycetota bacterium]